MATVVKCNIEDPRSSVVVQKGVDISGGLPTMDTEVLLVIDSDALRSHKEKIILQKITKKLIWGRS